MPEQLELSGTSNNEPTNAQRDVYFGTNRGWASVSIVSRKDLAGGTTEGPLIVEEYDSTTVVPPGWNASGDQWSNIILEKLRNL